MSEDCTSSSYNAVTGQQAYTTLDCVSATELERSVGHVKDLGFTQLAVPLYACAGWAARQTMTINIRKNEKRKKRKNMHICEL